MDRRDYYIKQKVTEGELDAGFDGAEDAVDNLAREAGLFGIVVDGGARQDSPVAGLSIILDAPTSAYDNAGKRMAFDSDQTVDLSVDENSATTAVSTPGNERYLSVFLEHDRALSDPRTDGNGDPVFFVRDDSFKLNVVQGAEAPVGTAARPALRADQVLLCDVLIAQGQTEVLDADISFSRSQYAHTSTGREIAATNPKDALDQLVAYIASENAAQDATTAKLASANVFTAANEFQDDVTIPAADDIKYAATRTVTRIVPLTSFVAQDNDASPWLLTNGGNPYWEVPAASDESLIGTLPIPDGAEITQVRIRAYQEVSGTNQLRFRLLRVETDTTTLVQSLASTTNDVVMASFGSEAIVTLTPAAGIAQQDLTDRTAVSGEFKKMLLRVTAGDSADVVRLLAVEVTYEETFLSNVGG